MSEQASYVSYRKDGAVKLRAQQVITRGVWDRTEFGRDWTLEIEEGKPDTGYEYPTSIGRIDLLAKRRDGQEYLVIGLKRGQTSDDTIGQILRYMGWVEVELLESGECVRGLIIAHSEDDRLRYALRRVQDVELKLYEVSFRHYLDAEGGSLRALSYILGHSSISTTGDVYGTPSVAFIEEEYRKVMK